MSPLAPEAHWSHATVTAGPPAPRTRRPRSRCRCCTPRPPARTSSAWPAGPRARRTRRRTRRRWVPRRRVPDQPARRPSGARPPCRPPPRGSRPRELVADREQPVQPGDAHVVDPRRRHRRRGRQRGLGRDRRIRRAAATTPTRPRAGAAPQHARSGDPVHHRAREVARHGRHRVGVQSRGQDGPIGVGRAQSFAGSRRSGRGTCPRRTRSQGRPCASPGGCPPGRSRGPGTQVPRGHARNPSAAQGADTLAPCRSTPMPPPPSRSLRRVVGLVALVVAVVALVRLARMRRSVLRAPVR